MPTAMFIVQSMRVYIGALCLGLYVLVTPLFSAAFVPGDILVRTSQPWQSYSSRLQGIATSPNLNIEIKSVVPIVSKSAVASRLSSSKTKTPESFYIYKLKVDPESNISDIAQTLTGQMINGNQVLVAQPNHIYTLSTYPTKDAPGYDSDQLAPLSLIGMEEAWDFGVGSENVVIAVIDSGIDTDHNEFVGQLWQNPGEIAGNGIDDDNNGFIDDIIGYNFASDTGTPEDGNGHGTHVAGIIAAKGNFLTGVCPGCRIMSVKAANNNGGLTESDIIQGITYAIDNGATIVNMSFGGYFASNNTQSISQALITEGYNNGISFVAALGNDTLNVDTFLMYPAKYTHVLGISSVGNTGSRSGFSNFGSYNFIAAPGGQDITPETFIEAPYLNNSYAGLAGTSMATPHVAGAIGLMKSLMPWLTPDEIRTALQLSAQDVGSSGHDIYYGYGILDVPNAIRYADTIPASVSALQTPSNVAANIAATVQVMVTDNMRVENVRLYYRYYLQNSPMGDWDYVSMSAIGGNLYSGEIPPGPAASTAIHTYIAAYDLHPDNPSYLPTGGAENPSIILYPDDIASPNITFVGQSGEYLDAQVSAWVTDNHSVATDSISVTVNTGIDEGNFTMNDSAVQFEAGLLTLILTETDLAIPSDGSILVTIQAADTTGNVQTASQTFSRIKPFKVQDGESRTDSFLTYPNPFNPQHESCVFSYNLSKDSDIQITIYSLAMRKVQSISLPESDSLAGYHEYSWDGRDYSGNILPNGVYLALMTVQHAGETKILKRHLAIKR
jgi:thermitase